MPQPRPNAAKNKMNIFKRDRENVQGVEDSGKDCEVVTQMAEQRWKIQSIWQSLIALYLFWWDYP